MFTVDGALGLNEIVCVAFVMVKAMLLLADPPSLRLTLTAKV
jgi:hypothetical protein